ncbi:hypothetical protein MLD38_009622 [Melastoma candidum]|uniref:Uncharacterized protein n=1 Tax=Melastoma candidum TaxID=119954 RepID=A0ACB9S172_9MYRT|nr:hypothetical protein MLD38_009622 [Melastoma candidum]
MASAAPNSLQLAATAAADDVEEKRAAVLVFQQGSEGIQPWRGEHKVLAAPETPQAMWRKMATLMLPLLGGTRVRSTFIAISIATATKQRLRSDLPYYFFDLFLSSNSAAAHKERHLRMWRYLIDDVVMAAVMRMSLPSIFLQMNMRPQSEPVATCSSLGPKKLTPLIVITFTLKDRWCGGRHQDCGSDILHGLRV